MAAADMHHRTAEFRQLFTKVLTQMQQFIGTANDVVILSSSGTGAMEAAVSNLTSPGDRVLVLSAGKFGERWTSVAKAFSCVPEVVSAPYGSTVSVEEVKAKLTPDIRVLFMQATETSTGVRHDVSGIAKLLKGSDTLLVVDAITGLGTTHLDIDADGIDLIIGGSQKALMVPPGLSYLAASGRAWKRMEQSKHSRYYFDLPKERKNQVKGESAYTPSVALIAAFGAALDYLEAQGGGDLPAGRRLLIDSAERCAAMTRAAVQALGLKLFATASPAAAVTAVKAPAGADSTDIVKRLKSDFGAVIADGQGEMKGQLFRIAHLGYFDYMDTISLIGALEHVISAIAPSSNYELGSALAAAQRVFADSARQTQAAAR